MKNISSLPAYALCFTPSLTLSLSLCLSLCLSPRVVGLICETAVPGIHPRLGFSFIAASSLLFYVIIKGTPQRGRFGSSYSQGSTQRPVCSGRNDRERDRERERERERKRENARVENDDRETVKEGRRERGKEKAWKNGDALCRREEGKRERKRGGKDREEKTEATTPRYVRPRSLILNYPDTCAEEMTVRVIGDVLLQRPCIVSMYVPRFFLSSPIFSFLLLSLLSPLLSSYHPNLLSSRLSLPLF